VLKLSEKHPRYGYRRITALLRRAGLNINPKRVQRLRRMEGVQVWKKQKRMRRVGLSTVERLRATKARQVWSSRFC
jgi:transposase InsO family protein